MSIINPADYVIRSVIGFLNVKLIGPADIHCQFVEVYAKAS
jgi:hypothetical protein